MITTTTTTIIIIIIIIITMIIIIIIKITRQVLGRPECGRGAIPRTLVQSNVVRSRLIILINEEINEANGPDKIVAERKKKNCSGKKNL